MNSITFYFGYILAVVIVRVCNADYDVFSEVKATYVGPFNFRYDSKDFLLMEITLKNIPPSVTAVYVIYSTKKYFYQKDLDPTPERKKVQAEIKNGDVTISFQRSLKENNILVDVELQTTDGLCQTSRVAEGRSASQSIHHHEGYTYYWYTDWKHDDSGSCLVPKPCAVEMDFKNQCQDTFNCYVKAKEYICTFQPGKEKKIKSYIYQTYDTGVLKYEPRNKASFQKDYTYLEAVDSFYKIHTKPKTWNDAKEACAQEGATLFYPENGDEAKAVITFWNPTSERYMWVGISDSITEGIFVTVDGRSISEVHNAWRKSQPDNYNTENCVHIDKNSEYNDIPCDVKPYSFICKESLLQNIQLDLSSVIGAPLNILDMKTKLIFDLELFDNNTSVHFASPKLQRSHKIILTAEDVVKEYIVGPQIYSETTEVQFSCEEYRARSKYNYVALIKTKKEEIQTFNETKIRRKFKMADSGSILCCLYYVYELTKDGKELHIKRFVLNKTMLNYMPEGPMSPNSPGIPDGSLSSESNDYYSYLFYVLSALLVVSALVLALYMISKQRWFKNSQPVEETVELDTHEIQNQVLYASLDFVNNGIQPQNQNEESHYAEIIGVLHP